QSHWFKRPAFLWIEWNDYRSNSFVPLDQFGFKLCLICHVCWSNTVLPTGSRPLELRTFGRQMQRIMQMGISSANLRGCLNPVFAALPALLAHGEPARLKTEACRVGFAHHYDRRDSRDASNSLPGTSGVCAGNHRYSGSFRRLRPVASGPA